MAEVTGGALARLAPGGTWIGTVECEPGHEPTRLDLELTADGSRLRARDADTQVPLAVAPHEALDAAGLAGLLAPPPVGAFRVWVDRMAKRRQGQVMSVDGDGYVELATVGGGKALVPAVWLEPPPGDGVEPGPGRTPEQVVAAVRQAAEGGVKDAVGRVYDVLREADPDGDRDDLRLRAGHEVRETAVRLGQVLADDVARIRRTASGGDDGG